MINGPLSYIYHPSNGDENNYCHGVSFTCGYILSIGIPKEYNISNYVGQTSWSLSREVPYDKLDKSKASPTYEETLEDRYQKENCPEFYACLPLIKI